MAIAWHEFSSREELDKRLAMVAAQRLNAQLSDRDGALLAVSGGSTPKGFFRQLSQHPLAWDCVTIALVDERFVPPEHKDSNQRLLNEALRQGPAAHSRLLPMYGEQDIAVAAQSCADELEKHLPCGLLVLGMGGDGHTASWFPDSPQLDPVTDAANEQLVAVVDTPSSPHQRLTMTMNTVVQAAQIVLHITGAEKRAVLEANLSGAANDPISRIINRSGTTVDVYWAA